MSIGLNDLKKRATPPTKTASTKNEGAGAVSENWARPTFTARPWTSEGLSKAKPTPAKKRRSSEAVEASMSNDWADDHTSATHAFDMEAQSTLAKLQDLKIEMTLQAIELERKFKRASKGPLLLLRSVLSLVQK